MADDFEEKYFSGKHLYGDDFTEKQIAKWYREEENASYAQRERRGVSHVDQYQALNHYHLFKYLVGNFSSCVAIGCAGGEELIPLAHRVTKFIAIEPAEEWWTSDISGVPVKYIKPNIKGTIPLTSECCGLVVCLSVLHHIPNVSFVLSEIARILEPGGLLLLREPNNILGDWRQPRGNGGSPNERGLPTLWLQKTMKQLGLDIIHRSFSMFPATWILSSIFGVRMPFNSPFVTTLDAFLSQITAWNISYYRNTILKKIAPGTNCYIARKLG
ncbi:MAG: class I SAM-dependent methyltransferase [Gammaproteobacteria bacterium]